MDVSTGQVLVEKEMNQQMYPASITKIMTVLLALENADPATVHTMSYEATHSIDPGSTHIALTEGEQITLKDLIYATMVASANDAANGIAECVGGSIDQFCGDDERKSEGDRCGQYTFCQRQRPARS